MNKVTTRIIIITFNNKIQPWEVPQFRGGIIHKVGMEHDWFHNHNNQIASPNFLYRYPLIQYRYHKGNPQLICIQNGVEEVQQLFSKSDWEIRIGDRMEKLSIKDLNLKAIEVEVVDYPCNYQLQHWLPFNSKNHERYKALEYETDRIQFLEKMLTGHILGFAEGIGWQVENQINARIKRIVKQKIVPYKNTKMIAMNIDFTVNAKLPFQAGLGQGTSRGFGLLNVPTNVLKNGSTKKLQEN
jgi:hypothetical protein